MDISKLVLNDEEIDDLSYELVGYVKKKIFDKNHTKKVNFDDGTYFDMRTESWKPIRFNLADMLDAATYGSQRMYDRVFNKALKDSSKKTAKKPVTYGSKNIIQYFVSRNMGRETLTINEIVNLLEILFGQ